MHGPLNIKFPQVYIAGAPITPTKKPQSAVNKTLCKELTKLFAVWAV